jgi:hypothetical protein
MDVKPSLQWALDTLQKLSKQCHTGMVSIRLVNGGVQGMSVNEELSPQRADHAASLNNKSF